MNGSDAHLLDAYLDGLLSPDAGSTFETELHRKPELRHQVEMQRLIDEALRRLFTAPPMEQVVAPMSAARDGRSESAFPQLKKPGSRRIRTVLGIAAAISIAALALYRLSGFLNAPAPDGRYFRTNQQAMDVIYHEKVANGFLPEWKCDDADEFARSFKHQLFQPLVLMTPPAGLSMGGLGYCNTLSPHSMFMLARAQDEKVIVFFDRLQDDRKLPPLSDTRLHRFRRELGELVLYEVTPLDEPRFLPFFSIPPQ